MFPLNLLLIKAQTHKLPLFVYHSVGYKMLILAVVRFIFSVGDIFITCREKPIERSENGIS